ncbi:MAG: hypothetical protein AAFX58_01885 [Pseudomonadota bacterium]
MLNDDELTERLRALPDEAPPRHAWRALRGRASAEGLLAAPAPAHTAGSAYRWLGLAAALMLVAFLAMPWLAQTPVSEPVAAVETVSAEALTLQAVMRRSQLLDRALQWSPPQAEVVPAALISRTTALEDRIAAIDRTLLHESAAMDDGRRAALWAERVDRMSSLVEIRYAGAREVSL